MTRLATLLRTAGLPVLAASFGLSFIAAPALAKRHFDLAETQVEIAERCASSAPDAGEACTLAIAGEERARRRADLLAIRGWHANSDRRHGAALADFEAAIKLSPGSHSAERGRAVSLSELGRYDEALAAIEAMLEQEARAILYADRGIIHARRGQHPSAIADYDVAISLEPGNRNVRILRAQSLMSRGEPQAALRDLDAVLALEPGHGRALYWRGLALGAAADHRGAVATFNDALMRNPGAISVWLERGKAFERLADNERALRSYEYGLRRAPQDHILLFRKSFALIQLGRHQEALAATDAAIAADPRNDVAHANRGWLLTESGRHAEAMDAAAQALKLAPDSPQALQVRGLARLALAQPKAALADLDKALQLRGRDADDSLHLARGRVLDALERPDAAAQAYERAAQGTASQDAMRQRGMLAERLGRWEEALRAYERALSMRRDPETLARRDAMLVRLGRGPQQETTTAAVVQAAPPRDRLAELTAAIRLDPFDTAARLDRVRLLDGDAGSRSIVRADLDHIITFEPGRIEALVRRAHLAIAERRFQPALADADAALALQPGMPSALFQAARAREGLGQIEQAISAYSMLIAQNPALQPAWFNRALLWRKAGRIVSAVVDMARASSLAPQDSAARQWGDALVRELAQRPQQSPY